MRDPIQLHFQAVLKDFRNTLQKFLQNIEFRKWEFPPRIFDLGEEVTEEIDQYAKPNKTRDKSLKMLIEWVNTSSDATWKALREAIKDTENTRSYCNIIHSS